MSTAIPYNEIPLTGKEMSGPTVKSRAYDFSWSETDEPHATRRKLILAKHPEIATLFGRDSSTFYVCLGVLIAQLFVAYVVRDYSWGVIFLVAYVFGGTVNHTLQLAVHDLSHNLCWATEAANKWTGIMGNLATGMPSAITFQKYHMEHHQFQGVDDLDVDVPSNWEVGFFTNMAMKLLWTILQPAFYALRPMFVRPKKLCSWTITNHVVQFSFDAAVVYFMGWRALAYLLMGTLLGLGLHPTAGHFIAEHYEFVKGYETYSYYGPINFTNLNVGYHNEHHDFPKVPWTRLPKVRAMAPEFYEDLPQYNSYLYVFYKYITDPEVGPWSRIKRTNKKSRN